jgi:2-octaprenyl-6-methoxyphenol hydroxylase
MIPTKVPWKQARATVAHNSGLLALATNSRLRLIAPAGRIYPSEKRADPVAAMKSNTDVIVAGTGLVGLAAALALARAGFRVALAGPKPNGTDRRTTAIMAPGLDFLDRLGVRAKIERHAAPLREMRIIDITNRLFRAPPASFKAREAGLDSFGWNIPNGALAAALAGAIEAEPSVTWREALVEGWRLDGLSARAGFADGTHLETRLVAAADGRNSPARTAAGIAARSRALPQSALVLAFAHSRDHGFTSTEFHTEQGPFTQVPLPGRRSSLVWVTRPSEAERLLGLDDAALGLAVEAKMQSMLGQVTVEPGRQVFPLSSATAERFGARRVALLGEAGHVMPPIGAQGLNLGLRDVADLVALARLHREDPGSEAFLARYDRARRADVAIRGAAVALLNGSLLSSFLPLQMLRGAGLAALNAVPPLRALAMREGMAPGSGLPGLLDNLRERVGRQHP